ncbi:hypothetical protein [Tumebacillus algifaecis]|nr:hypothetical protein [Tumebacillus algifaecis]
MIGKISSGSLHDGFAWLFVVASRLGSVLGLRNGQKINVRLLR